MRIQGGLNKPFQGRKQDAKGDYPFFVIVHASVDHAIANPGVFQDIKIEFLNSYFDDLDVAKQEILTRVNQFRDADSGYIPSFYIWQALAGKFSSYIKNSCFLNNDPSPIQSMGIQDQWQFEPQTNGFLQVPFQTLTASNTFGSQASDTTTKRKEYRNTVNWVQFEDTDASELEPTSTIDPSHFEPISIYDKTHTLMQHFRCPLSHLPFTIPFISPSGNTYHYDALKTYLAQTGQDPKTKESLTIDTCIPNVTIRHILENFSDVLTLRTRLLLCPYTRLPLQKPVLINPTTHVGKALLSLTKKNKDTRKTSTLFQIGVSYNRDTILSQQKNIRPILENAKITPADMIPNYCLANFLKKLINSKKPTSSVELD